MNISFKVENKLYNYLKYQILDKNFKSVLYRNKGKLTESDKAAQIIFLIIKLSQIIPTGFVRIDRNLFYSFINSTHKINDILNKLEELDLIIKYGHGSKCLRTIKSSTGKEYKQFAKKHFSNGYELTDKLNTIINENTDDNIVIFNINLDLDLLYKVFNDNNINISRIFEFTNDKNIIGKFLDFNKNSNIVEVNLKEKEINEFDDLQYKSFISSLCPAEWSRYNELKRKYNL